MTNIKVNDIELAGAELFNDSESYLMNLSENELDVYGGVVWTYYIYQGAAFTVRSSNGCLVVAGAAVNRLADALDD